MMNLQLFICSIGIPFLVTLRRIFTCQHEVFTRGLKKNACCSATADNFSSPAIDIILYHFFNIKRVNVWWSSKSDGCLPMLWSSFHVHHASTMNIKKYIHVDFSIPIQSASFFYSKGILLIMVVPINHSTYTVRELYTFSEISLPCCSTFYGIKLVPPLPFNDGSWLKGGCIWYEVSSFSVNLHRCSHVWCAIHSMHYYMMLPMIW